MRVLHVSAGNLYGGVETLLVAVAAERMLCPEMEPHFSVCFEGRLSRELQHAGALVHVLGEVRSSRPWTVWRARRKLEILLSRERFDAVVCHLPWSLAIFAPAVRRSKIPLAYWVHGAASGGWLERWAARFQPDLVIANSNFTKSSVRQNFPESRDCVIYPPVRFPVIEAGKRECIRREMGIAPETVVIIQTSRLEAWKGHETLIGALQILGRSMNWVCWMLGGAQRPSEQAYLAGLRQLAVSRGVADRVVFMGQKSNVPEFLAAADIFCQPNTGPEPFGIALIEALWAGIPVVTANIGAAPEILAQSFPGLVPPNDSAALAGTLRKMIASADWRSELGKRGPERARLLCEPGNQLQSLARNLRALMPAERPAGEVVAI